MRLLITTWMVLSFASTAFAETSLETLEQTAKANRRDANAQSAYAHALLAAKRLKEAKRFFKQAAKLDDTLVRRFDVARVAFAEGNYKKARAACRPLEKKDRNSAITHVCRARAFLVWNRSGRAFEELEAAVAQDPNSFETQLALGDAHRLRAALQKSEEAYKKAIALAATRAEPHLGLGLLYANANRRDDALRSLNEAHRLDGSDAEILYELGSRERGQRAVDLLKKAAESRKGFLPLELALADAQLRVGNTAGAEEALQRAVAIDKENGLAQAGLGRLAWKKNELDKALTYFAASLAAIPSQPHVVTSMGQIYEKQSKNEEAFDAYRRASAIDPSNPRPLMLAAVLAVRLERPVYATGFLDRILEKRPKHSRALEVHGDIAMSKKQRDKASDYYQRALEKVKSSNRSRVQTKLAASKKKVKREIIHRATR